MATTTPAATAIFTIELVMILLHAQARRSTGRAIVFGSVSPRTAARRPCRADSCSDSCADRPFRWPTTSSSRSRRRSSVRHASHAVACARTSAPSASESSPSARLTSRSLICSWLTISHRRSIQIITHLDRPTASRPGAETRARCSACSRGSPRSPHGPDLRSGTGRTPRPDASAASPETPSASAASPPAATSRPGPSPGLSGSQSSRSTGVGRRPRASSSALRTVTR